MQVDDTISRLSKILRKARNVKNCLAPVNKIPPETLALTAAFLATERDLINATAVCQQWRTVLLSFPRLWRNAGGSSSELEAYLERSGSVPLEVTLSSPQLVVSIIPHTSRLVALTVCVDSPPRFDQIAEHLCDPIPTLRSLEIRAENRQLHHTLELPSGLREGLFRHLKNLSLNAISSLHGPQTFPHITELFLCTNMSSYRPPADFLITLERLPGLVKISVVFQASWYDNTHSPNTVALPCVQEMHLRSYTINKRIAAIPPILQFLELPKATSITLQPASSSNSGFPILPVTFFSERLPNYVELPELRIDTTMSSIEAVFRGPSQAVLTYKTGSLRHYGEERRLWGDLPISSVRRVTAVLVDPFGDEDIWLADMLGEPDFLDLLELGGDCGWVLRRLRRRSVRGIMRICDIKTLIVRGGEYAKSQALKLESVKDDIGRQNMTVTYILDPEAHEPTRDLDSESSSDDDDWDENSEEDSVDYGDDAENE